MESSINNREKQQPAPPAKINNDEKKFSNRWIDFGKKILNSIPNLSLFVLPLLLLPLVVMKDSSNDKESKCLYIILIMATYWSLNPIPLPITSMLPIILLPLLGLASTEAACSAYFRANNMLFFGCLTLALAIEKSNLHQRIALKILSTVSTQFRSMLLGFMMTTMFFSMFLVSTATVALMLPIADEIFNNIFASIEDIKQPEQSIEQQQNGEKKLKKSHHHHHHREPLTITKLETIVQNNYEKFQKSNQLIFLNNNNNDTNNGQLSTLETTLSTTQVEIEPAIENPSAIMEPFQNGTSRNDVLKLFYLCIAYSATIGGVSTLTSNGPNLIMKDILENQYENKDPVDYATWLLFATPISILSCFLLWVVFSLTYFRKVSITKQRQIILRKHIVRKYQRLGSITFHEWAVLFIFFIMILLYMSYKPQFISGWSVWFDDYRTIPKPASAAILCVIILFLIPSNLKSWNPNLKQDALMDWQTIQKKLEWGVLIIRGGGFALADAVESSGLSKTVGSQLSQLGAILPLPALIAFISVVANLVIEFMRTSATASILFPVAIKLSENMGVNPLKIVIPCATSCAYAFISPVGTASNTLIFYHGKMSIKDMIIPGLIAKTLTLSMMMLNTFLLGDFIFGINDNKPDWLILFHSSNDIQQQNHNDIQQDFQPNIDLIYPLGIFDNITTTTTTSEAVSIP